MAPATQMSLASTLPLGGFDARVPVVGLGLWQSARSVCKNTCLAALRNGYRHIDTAQCYHNEAEVGQAVRESGVPRADIFITTKVLTAGRDAEDTYAKCVRSVEVLSPGDDGYVDLFLVHTASGGASAIKAMWQALERLHKAGKARAIGVSNFSGRQIESLREYATIWPPAVDQIELHPWLQQRETVKYCEDNGIQIEAYCPLTRMQKANDPHVLRIAKAAGKSAGQVLVRYCLEKGWVPLPKSDKEHRIKENAGVFDFEIGAEDMETLDRREAEDGKLVLCEET